MPTALTYRQASGADIDQLQALGQESYGEFAQVLGEQHWNTMNGHLVNRAGLSQLIEQSVVFVCETNSQIVGMIYLVPSGQASELFDKQWSHIRFLGVHTAYRGLGIGKRLTDHCITHARETGETHIALHTSEFMDAARAIYEKRGFRQTKELEYLGKRYWIYLLGLK